MDHLIPTSTVLLPSLNSKARLSLLACLGQDNNSEGERFKNHKQTPKVALGRVTNILTTSAVETLQRGFLK